MKVNIKNIVNNFKEKISMQQALYETVSNSLEANASLITIRLHQSNTIDETKAYDSFDVIDNGEGFNEKNRNSFLEYLSSHKIDLGCKGIGRFTWLKVFSTIDIVSYFNNEVVSFSFTENFKDDDIKIEKSIFREQNETTVSFKNCKIEQNDYLKGDLHTLINNLLDHFVIKLLSLNKLNKEFIIIMTDNESQEQISNSNLPKLQQESFQIRNNYEDINTNFYLHYTFFENKKSENKVLLCANNRAIKDINKSKSGEIIANLPNKDSLLCLVSSDYLDKIVDDTRTKLIFNETDNQLSGFTEEEIKKQIKKEIEIGRASCRERV